MLHRSYTALCLIDSCDVIDFRSLLSVVLHISDFIEINVGPFGAVMDFPTRQRISLTCICNDLGYCFLEVQYVVCKNYRLFRFRP